MSDILFQTGQYQLKSGAREALAKIAGVLLPYPGLTLEVDGFTDNTGSEDVNQRLSEKRAEAVRDFLVEQGVPANTITAQGLGESTCVGLGGDPVVGSNYVEVLKWFQSDPCTRGVALVGEIGGDAEERAAEFIAQGGLTKPCVAYIAGRTAVPGKRMGHAGAIIQGSSGTAESKMNALRGAGVSVVDKPLEVALALRKALG